MKADPKADAAAAPKSSKKKLLVIIIMGVLVVSLGGGAAWFFTRSTGGEAHEKPKHAIKPETVNIEQFTVNLQPEDGGDHYLQLQFTLQVANPEQVEVIKDNMARVRSRVLLLLSAKKASELTSVEGKRQLSNEIIAAIKQPFSDKGPPQEVTDVLFTNFIIQ